MGERTQKSLLRKVTRSSQVIQDLLLLREGVLGGMADVQMASEAVRAIHDGLHAVRVVGGQERPDYRVRLMAADLFCRIIGVIGRQQPLGEEKPEEPIDITDYENRSTEELRFWIAMGRWPTGQEISQMKEEKC